MEILKYCTSTSKLNLGTFSYFPPLVSSFKYLGAVSHGHFNCTENMDYIYKKATKKEKFKDCRLRFLFDHQIL